jgi:hypothetical protein
MAVDIDERPHLSGPPQRHLKGMLSGNRIRLGDSRKSIVRQAESTARFRYVQYAAHAHIRFIDPPGKIVRSEPIDDESAVLSMQFTPPGRDEVQRR